MKSLLKKPSSQFLVLTMAMVLLPGCATRPAEKAVLPAEPQANLLPQSVRDNFDAAVKLIESEQYEKGIELLNGVVTKSQKHAVPYINLGVAHARLGNTKAAEENLNVALAIEPDNPVASNEMGMVLRKTGRFSEARKVYEGVLKKYPDFPLANRNLGILCDLYLRDYDCALKGYEAYSKAEPEDKNVRIWISDVQKKIGK